MVRTAQIIVLSCERRGIELEHVRRFLRGNGYELLDDLPNQAVSREADLILLSTCAYSRRTEDLSLEILNQIKRRKKPGAEVVVCGCLPEINAARLSEVFDGRAFGPRDYNSLNSIVHATEAFESFDRDGVYQLHRPHTNPLAQTLALVKSRDNLLKGISYARERIMGYPTRVRLERLRGWQADDVFYIQIHEGCACDCSYCAIRLAIKELKSKPIEEVIGLMKKGLAQGYSAFDFTGDSCGVYGFDRGENLGDLLEAVLGLEEPFTLRLNDISPMFLYLCIDSLRKLASREVVSSLHIPIQSASSRVLGLMRRPFDIDGTKEMLLSLKQIPGLKIGTSVMVGFPSETLNELDETIRFCESIPFDWVTCHAFSPRPGTDAAALPGMWDQGEKTRRCRLVKSRLKTSSLVSIRP